VVLTAPDIFDVSSPVDEDAPSGFYVALSGNTSAGKSSLIESLDARARAAGLPSVGISERQFHDRFLQLMFSQPENFAFPIQLSFMLQRHLILLRNLQLGRLVILERSHFDDVMFVREHRDQGRISASEFDAYLHLAEALHRKIPAPDVLVLMNPDPEVSLRRLSEAEESGRRPREFPDESSKREWVHRWHRYYVDLHDDYRARSAGDPAFEDVCLIELETETDTEEMATEVFDAIRSVAAPHLQCR
jgi:deoxyadenosine/deoxycytidine kinase